MRLHDLSPRRVPLRLEPLEERSLLAVTATLTGTNLLVNGTPGPDRIAVVSDAPTGQLVVSNGTQEIGRFAQAAVTTITLNGQGGNDTLTVNVPSTIASTLNGGEGDDALYVVNGSAASNGGAGDDRLEGGPNNDSLNGGLGNDVLLAGLGTDNLTGGGGRNRFLGFADADTITDLTAADTNLFQATTPPDLSMTLGIPPSPAVTITAAEVGQLLQRAAAATASDDAIIAIVDRGGRILGVRVEAGVAPEVVNNLDTFVFAVDGAVAKARTGAFFGNNQAPLTSRTIQFISQTTITEREVNSNPSITDPNSTLRGPGFVAPVGIQNHFPPGVPFTPQVDLFAIEHTNRDSTYHPGPDRIKGTADDILLNQRFNIDQAFIPGSIPATQYLAAPDSYGFVSGLRPNAQNRGIATLPGGIPIVKNGAIVGGIGVFFPGKTGFATEENSSLSSTFDASKLDRSMEAEFIAFAALGGSAGAGVSYGALGGIAPVAGVSLPFGRIDLVGITLPLFGPGGIKGPENLARFGLGLGIGQGNPNSGFLGQLLNPGANNKIDYAGAPPALAPADPVLAGGLLDGTLVPEGYLVTPHDGAGITAAEVQQIIVNAVARAQQTRAAIRLPINSETRMMVAVADRNGALVGLFRMPDATVFSIDVAVSKARNVNYYSDATRLQVIDAVPGVPPGTAFTNRTFRFLALPRFPEGIDGAPPGPFSQLNDPGTNPRTARNTGAPVPASAFQSVLGYDAFNPQTNFRDMTSPIQNQSGIVFFPGSVTLYRNTTILGGFGISGDGVDQDDVVTDGGEVGFRPPERLRVDFQSFRGVRLPYQKFNRQPNISGPVNTP